MMVMMLSTIHNEVLEHFREIGLHVFLFHPDAHRAQEGVEEICPCRYSSADSGLVR